MIIGPTSSSYASYIPIAQPAANSRMVVEPVTQLRESTHEVGYTDLQQPSQSGAAFKQAVSLLQPDNRMLSALLETEVLENQPVTEEQMAGEAQSNHVGQNVAENLVQAYRRDLFFGDTDPQVGANVNIAA